MAGNNGTTDLENDVDDGQQETAEERLSRLENNQAVMSILNDEDVQKVVALKRAGKGVNVGELEGNKDDANEKEKDEVEEEPDPISLLPDSDPKKAQLQAISSLVDKKLGKAQEYIKSLEERLERAEGVAGQVVAKEVNDQITKVAGKYQDFKEHRSAMTLLAKSLPGLNVEELYLVAKQRAGKLKLAAQGTTDSERPTSQPRNNSTKRGGQPVRPQGRRGFNEILADALGKFDLEAGQE